MKCNGILWFYSGDLPYLHFQVDNLNLFLSFTTVSYHKPWDTITPVIVDNIEDTQERDEMSAAYKESLPLFRSWKFYNPDSTLSLYYNCFSFYLGYGTSSQEKIQLKLSRKEAELVSATMDRVFDQGVKDAYGDFQRNDSPVIIPLGINLIVSYQTQSWEYKRTDRPCNHEHKWVMEPIVLAESTMVEVLPHSSSLVPPQSCCIVNNSETQKKIQVNNCDVI